MPRLVKKICPKIIILFFLLLFTLALPANAINSLRDWNLGVQDQNNVTKPVFDKVTIENTIHEINSLLAGDQFNQILDTGSLTTSPTSLNQNGAIGLTANFIAYLIGHPPATGTQYLAYMGSKAGLIPSAYAQGFAFPTLEPILKIWVVFRNLAYLAFVFIFIITGLMIMFRVKLDPQTTISIEQALPKLIASILLVTFSFAIAGFLIEFMYILMILAITYFGSQIGLDSQTYIQKVLSGDFVFFIGEAFGVITEIGRGLAYASFALLGSPAAENLAGIGKYIIGFFFAILFVISLLKILLLVISSYIEILKLIIFSPFQIMLDALPIQALKGGFTKWLRSLIANILVFPTLVFLFILAKAIMTLGGSTSLWTPPLLPRTVNFPVAPTFLPIVSLISWGIIQYMPKAGNELKKALTEEKPGPSPLGTGGAALTQILQSLEQRRMWMAMGAGGRPRPAREGEMAGGKDRATEG